MQSSSPRLPSSEPSDHDSDTPSLSSSPIPHELALPVFHPPSPTLPAYVPPLESPSSQDRDDHRRAPRKRRVSDPGASSQRKNPRARPPSPPPPAPPQPQNIGRDRGPDSPARSQASAEGGAVVRASASPPAGELSFNMDDYDGGDYWDGYEEGEIIDRGVGYSDDGMRDEAAGDVESPVAEYARWLFEARRGQLWPVLHITRIDQRCWVVEGYRDDQGNPEPGSFYHVTSLGETSMCDCSANQKDSPCIHREVFHFARNQFNAEVPISDLDNPSCISIIPNAYGYQNWLSVRASNSERDLDRKRVIVLWCGSDDWICRRGTCRRAKAGGKACIHRTRAKKFLNEVMGIATDVPDMDGDDELGDMDELPRLRHQLQNDPVMARAYTETRPRSHLPVPPPAFCALPGDETPRHRHIPLHLLPGLLPIGDDARCYCGSAGDPDSTQERACRIYGMNGVVTRRIEVRRCGCRSKGDRFTVGPDLGALSLFNWNNEIIIPHDVLNAYTSQLQRSPTPLTAFHQTILDSYAEHATSPTPDTFLAKTTWIKIWFAFTKIQVVDIPFSCPKDGNQPSTVIVDGVSVSFSSSQRTSALQPPTVPTGRVCKCVKPRQDLAFLPNKMTRTAVHDATSSASLENYGAASFSVAAQKLRQHLKDHPNSRSEEVTALAALLETLHKSPPPASLLPLYLDLLRQLAAHEWILQFVLPHWPAQLLGSLVLSTPYHPTQERLWELAKECPAFGNIFLKYYELESNPPSELKSVALLAASWAKEVFKKIKRPEEHEDPVGEEALEDNWRRTGVVYGAAKIRERPSYVNFRDGGGTGAAGMGWGYAPTREQREAEKKAEDLEVDKTCQKFYKRYSEAKQTGGMMVVWCPHGICCGFHIIPRAEGRNDVHSAIFTRWKEAPKNVIYDFACALAPYCLAREPEYWGSTKFMVDRFHQNDHTKCSPACFLSTYMANDEHLHKVNSSAAECGNAGLARIRKTVSYSTQEHAIQFTYQFLCVWNRLRILSLNASN